MARRIAALIRTSGSPLRYSVYWRAMPPRPVLLMGVTVTTMNRSAWLAPRLLRALALSQATSFVDGL